MKILALVLAVTACTARIEAHDSSLRGENKNPEGSPENEFGKQMNLPKGHVSETLLILIAD